MMMPSSPSVDHLLRGASRGQRTPENRDRPDGEVQKPRRRLHCVMCRHAITDDSQRFVLRGGHEHTFFNPHGVLFHLGCFRNAPGCTALGPPSAEFSWFAGYHWMLAFCARCRNHLGWRFQGGLDGPFHGLILNRIRYRDESGNE